MHFIFTLVQFAVVIGFFLLVVAVVSVPMGGLCYLLWNFAVVIAFGAPVLTFYQAWALWFLLSLIAGLFRHAREKD